MLATSERWQVSLRSAATWGIGIANMIAVISPDRVVIGGGIAAAGDLLLGPIRAELQRRVFITSLDNVTIVDRRAGHVGRGDRGGHPRRGDGVMDRVRGQLVLEDRVAPGELSVEGGLITDVQLGPDSTADGPFITLGSSTSTSTAGAATTRWAIERRSTAWPGRCCGAASPRSCRRR